MLNLIPHDHASETFVCRDCGHETDLASDTLPDTYTKADADAARCPKCGGTDTGWMFAPDQTTTVYVVSKELIRQQGAVYDTREDALAAGWPEAEYGWWVPSNCDLSRARWGWIALAPCDEE